MILGQHDESLMQYEIADGLEKEDLITFPEEGLEEGMKTKKSADGRMGQSNPPGMEEEFPEEGMSPEDGAVPEDMIEDGAVPEDITGDEAIPEDMTGDGAVSEEIPAEESQPEEIPAEGGTADAAPVG